jgi:hypothetical protein
MAAGLLNLIPSLPDFAGAGMNWAIGSMARNRYASQVRHLRRREYQDMMFSMKKAGLNPMLASGATPGHSAAYSGGYSGIGSSSSAGLGTAVAANRQAGAAERGVAVKETLAPSEVGLRAMQKYNIASEIQQRSLTNDLTQAQTEKTRREAQLALEQSGLALTQKLLNQRNAEKAGYSSQQLRLLNDQIEKGYNLTPLNTLGSVSRDTREYAKAEDVRRANDPNYHHEDDIAKFLSSSRDSIAEWLKTKGGFGASSYSGRRK